MGVSVILISHGKFARAALGSLEMIAGKQANMRALELLPEDGGDNLYEQLRSMMSGSDNQLLILVDIAGGTPANIATRVLLEGGDIQIFSGFNLPLLLEIATRYWQSLAEVTQFIEGKWSTYLTNINKSVSGKE